MLRNFNGTGYLAGPPEQTKNPNWLSFRVGFHRKEKDPTTGEEKMATLWARGLCSLKMIESTLHFYVAGAKVTVSSTDCWTRISQSKDGVVSSELSLGFVNYIYAFAKAEKLPYQPSAQAEKLPYQPSAQAERLPYQPPAVSEQGSDSGVPYQVQELLQIQ